MANINISGSCYLDDKVLYDMVEQFINGISKCYNTDKSKLIKRIINSCHEYQINEFF